MPSRTSTHRHNLAGGVARPRLGFAIEILILAGLVLVPLAFRGREWVAFYSQPKLFVLHLVALSFVVLWLFEAALDTRVDQQAEGSSIFDRADHWLYSHRHRSTMVSVAGFGFIFVVSVLLSPAPWVRVWGRVFGDLGS